MKIKANGVDDVVVMLDDKEHKRAYNMALGKISTKARGLARREMASEYKVKLKSTKGIAIKKYPKENKIILWGAGRRLNLIRDLRANDNKPAGVSFVLKSNVNILPKAFIANVKGSDHVFQRVGKSRLPIENLQSYKRAIELGLPRIDEMETNKNVIQKVDKMVKSSGKQEFERAITALISRKAKKYA